MLIRVAIDQSLEGCHQRHEHRDALTAAQLFQPVKQTPGIDHIDPGAPKVLNRWARKICREIEDKWRAELPKPVLHIFLVLVAVHALALPDGIIGELNRKLGQRRRLSGGKGLIKHRQFFLEDGEGPAVSNRMLHVDLQHEVVFGQTQQADAHQWSLFQIEGARKFFGRQTHCLAVAFFFGKMLQADRLQSDFEFGSDDLHGKAIDRFESCPQDFMSLNQLVDDALHDRHIERTTNMAGVEDVVGGITGLQLVYEPEPLLIYRGRASGGAPVLSSRDGLHRRGRGMQPFLFQTSVKQDALFRRQSRNPLGDVFHSSLKRYGQPQKSTEGTKYFSYAFVPFCGY